MLATIITLTPTPVIAEVIQPVPYLVAGQFDGGYIVHPAIPIYSEPVTVEEKIIWYSIRYELNETVALKVANCESSYIEDIYGDNGKAYGVYQFHRGTFDMFAKEFGEELDYYNTDHNIKLAIWAIKNGYGSHWTCWRWLESGIL